MSAPRTGAPASVIHVVTGLGAGGAERSLAGVVPGLDRSRWLSRVVVLGETGRFAEQLRTAGVEVECLGMPAGRPTWAGARRLSQIVARARPDLIQGWMYHGNLAGWLAGVRCRAPVIWNVRQTLGAPEAERPSTELVVRACARLSSRTAAIVYNARASAVQHEAIGYDASRRVVIPNGFDLRRFRPRPGERAAARAGIGVRADEHVAVCVARLHPVKDHAMLLAAFALVRSARPRARLVLVGEGTERLPAPLARRAAGLAVLGLGVRADVERVLAAADLAVLASRAEAFPNALGEAMASAVPCLATRVGDVADLVGETGRLVPPGDAGRFADAWIAALDEEGGAPGSRGARARRRIEDRFGLDAAVAGYDRLYSAALGRARP